MFLKLFNFALDQGSYTTIGVFTLLAIIVYHVSGLRKKVQGLYKKPNTQIYLNTVARIKALDYAPNAVISIDGDGAIVAWNEAAYSLFGYKEKEVVGKQLGLVIPERFAQVHKASVDQLKDGAAASSTIIVGKPLYINGRTKKGIELPIKIILWRWVDGPNVFYTSIIRDVTEETVKEKAYVDKLIMLERGEHLDQSGTWSWDILNDIVRTSTGFNRIFGIDTTFTESGYLLKRIYHEDIGKVEAAIKNAFTNKEGYKLRYRLVNPNGTLVEIETVAETFFDENDELINLTGVIHIV